MKYRQPPPGLFDLPTMSELRACWELCRLHGNTGFWVVWIPTAWSLLMAYHAHSEMSIGVPLYRALLYVPLCFGIKSLMMTIDDILDWDVDMEVERTKNRPIPRGSITPQRAWVFFALQVIVGVHFSLKFLSTTSLYVAMATWPMYVIYPDLKRWMDFAPIPLGMVFQVGIFMGWADISLDGSVPWHLLVPAYIGATLWTVAYETVYQHQDKEDDARIGLHSLALRMGTWTIPLCFLCAMSFLALIAYAGFENGHSITFFASVAIAGTLLMYRLLGTNINSSSDCKRMFLDTPTVGNIILFGLLADVLYHRLSTGIPI
ncbi:UbiA prenyltransferase [Pterulicium gracile]|uniref:UbiA prenyltransferase n=1 Tax=Pterulicium gracile TaxID=1884261 RepID=A0A5C3Q116_9AGAR|nr:UbiA prenyltransferase [Pterula gracilis]